MSDRFEIYCHRSPSGKRYVGVTGRGMLVRWGEHVRKAKEGKRDSKFYRAIRKHGADSFTHEILDVLTTEAGALNAEKLWIKELDTYRNGYNETFGSVGTYGCRGKKFSEQGRKNMSEAHKGLKTSPEAIAKSAKARTGLKRTPEFCAYLSELNKGRRATAEQIAKRVATMRGRPSPLRDRKQSAETIEKKRAATTGKKRTPEQRAEMSARQKGKIPSTQCRTAAKIALDAYWAEFRATGKGRTHTAETKAKMSATRKSAVARNRGLS